MTGQERPNNRERQDPLANTKRIVDLVFRLPVDPSKSEQVLDAVGTVYEDLRVLDERRRLDRQLARGLTTGDVDLAIANIHEAAALRPIDEVSTEQRMLVLAGLERIRQATLFNENVGQQGLNGIAIVQVGLTSRHVEAAMTDVREAQALIEQSQPTKPEPTISEPIIDDILETAPSESADDEVIEQDPPQDIIDVTTPTVTEQPYEDILDQVTAGFPNTSRKTPISRIPRVSRRRALLSGAGLLALGLTFGYGVDPENYSKKPEPTEEDKRAEDEQFIKEHSLTAEPITDNRGWSVSYPTLEERETFEDIFKGNFRQLYTNVNAIPVYTLQGENTPLAKENWSQIGMNMRMDISTSDFRDPLPIIQIADNTPRGNFNPSWSVQTTAVVSGRKNPELPDQRQFPFVVQFTRNITKETHLLQVKPISNTGKDNKPVLAYTSAPWVLEITYMKKVKKS